MPSLPQARPQARRAAALLAALALLLTPVAAGAEGTDDATWAYRPSVKGAPTNPLTTPGPFQGLDGRTYEHAPAVVRGKHGTVYFGEELDAACGYGRMFTDALDQLAKLARVIESSGRRVIFTVAPNKSAVNKRDLRTKRLPHGKCDLRGIKQQDRLLDRYKDRNYLGMRKPLAKLAAAGEKRLYWPIDTHWTKLSTVRYAKTVAKRLDPQLAKRQTYRTGHETIETDLSFLGIIPETFETGPAQFPTTPVTVEAVPGSVVYNPDVVISPVHEWTTSPPGATWPGRTLLIGDSFTYRGLDGLMPLFEHGEFLWVGQPGVPSVVDGIVAADTVVIEVVQRWLPISPLVRKPFKVQVRRALK